MSVIAIIIAVVCFSCQFIFTKLYEKTVKQTIITSLSMMIITNLAGSFLCFALNGFSIEVSKESLFFAFLFGVIMIPYFIIGIKVLELGSLAVYSMFMMLGGMLVPSFYGVVFLRETLSPLQILGTLLLILFIVLQSIIQKSTEKTINSNRKRLYLFLCILIFLINGLTGVIAKAHELKPNAINEGSFMFFSCVITEVISVILLIFHLIKNKEKTAREIKLSNNIKAYISSILIGVASNAGNFFILIAAEEIPASVQFSVISGGTIFLSTLCGVIIFKEKLKKSEWFILIGMLLSISLFLF